MILRAGSVPGDQITGDCARVETRLGRAGGLTGLGVNIVTIPPGSRSSQRHWHSDAEEFLLVLEGEATVIQDAGPQLLMPGDCAVWPAGQPDGHVVENRASVPLRYLIAGTNPVSDRVRYPDIGQTRVIEGADWVLIDDQGAVLERSSDPA